MDLRRAALLCLACAALSALAQSPQPLLKAGEYIAEGGRGVLVLKGAAAGGLAFSVDTTARNTNTCSLEGRLRGGRGELDGVDAGKPCIVRIASTPEGLLVRAEDPAACSGYCGLNAGFEGLYLAQSPACADKALAAARSDFRKLYDAKNYAAAKARLEPAFAACVRIVDESTAGRMRNDLAVTLHKLGDLAGCRSMLAPLAPDAARTDEEVREEYGAEASGYLPVVRATRTNLKLCRER